MAAGSDVFCGWRLEGKMVGALSSAGFADCPDSDHLAGGVHLPDHIQHSRILLNSFLQRATALPRTAFNLNKAVPRPHDLIGYLIEPVFIIGILP
jgi:hypothetical protein